MTFDIQKFDVSKFDSILSRGLCFGLGTQGNQVCIEAAICETLGLPHSDDPTCVAKSVRAFKICLNDSRWSSPEARAKGMRDLGLAQLGSLGVVADVQFAKSVAEKTIRRLLPVLFRSIRPTNPEAEALALRCEQEGTAEAARAARDFARAKQYADAAAYAYAAYAAAYAAYAAAYAAYADDADAAYAAAYAAAADDDDADAAAYAAYAAAAYAAAAADAAYAANAANAANAAAYADKYLNLSASIALETLRELNSPGIALLEGK